MLKYKKIKKEDTVKIIAGKDLGKTGKVLEVNRSKGKLLVEGVNIVKKAMKKTQENQSGGIKEIEAFFDISNVMVVCPKCKKETRIGFKVTDGKKVRVCKNSSWFIELIFTCRTG